MFGSSLQWFVEAFMDYGMADWQKTEEGLAKAFLAKKKEEVIFLGNRVHGPP
jgi:hypothetical protein